MDLLEKRLKLGLLKQEVRNLQLEVDKEIAENLRRGLHTLAPHRKMILSEFVRASQDYPDFCCISFKTLEHNTGLNRGQITKACRFLAKAGFIELYNGLFTEDGEPCGSAYGVTLEGFLWWGTHVSN